MFPRGRRFGCHPFPFKAYSLPLESFPASFQVELATWRRNQLVVDIFDDNAPPRAKRAVTVEHQADILRRFASLAVKLKVLQLCQIHSLADLLKDEVALPCLRYHVKTDGKGTRQMENIVNLLLSVARYHCQAPKESVKKLAGFAKRLRGDRITGLAEKNVRQLKQFDDPINVKKLLMLPFRMIEKIPVKISTHRKAKYWERALSIGVFIYTGLRTQNVRTIHLDKNIRRSAHQVVLSFAAEEMKNRRSLELVLHAGIAGLLDEYLAHHRKHLPGSHGRFLFPGRDGGSRPAATVRDDLSRTVLRWTGINLTPHQVRHFSAKVAIDKDPSLLMAVSQRLGHADPQTTIDYYLPNGSLPASRVMNDLLEEAAKSGENGVKKPKQLKRRKRKIEKDG